MAKRPSDSDPPASRAPASAAEHFTMSTPDELTLQGVSAQATWTRELRIDPPNATTLTLSFAVPTLLMLAQHANRLLKFQFPPWRDEGLYKRLLPLCVQSPKPPKSFWDTLPYHQLETLHQQVWQHTVAYYAQQAGCQFDDHSTLHAHNLAMQLVVFCEALNHFDADAWVTHDLNLLQEAGVEVPIPGGVFQSPFQLHHLDMVLSASLQKTKLLRPVAGCSIPLPIAYLLCRCLSRPLPWATLLMGLAPAIATSGTDQTEEASALSAAVSSGHSRFGEPLEVLNALPRLKRLAQIYTLLQQTERFQDWVRLLSQHGSEAATLQGVFEQVAQFFRSGHYGTLLREHSIDPPFQKLLIVEGATEERLIPKFTEAGGYRLADRAIGLIAAGGKNQVKALFQSYQSMLAIPVLMVLDQDAADMVPGLTSGLRSPKAFQGYVHPKASSVLGDRLFLFPEGEIEDVVSLTDTFEVLNRFYRVHPPITPEQYEAIFTDETGKVRIPQRRVEALREVWRVYHLGYFDKIDFAEKLAQTITPGIPLSKTLQALVSWIVE